MKKPKVAIVGYGNLGKGVEFVLQQNKDFRLVKIFSKRTGLTSPFGTKFEKTSNLNRYAGKIDILFLCVGSFSDIEKTGPQVIRMFNTVDSFDTHSKLAGYIANLDKIAKDNNKVALCAAGWDPGLMSIMRLIFNSIAPGALPSNSFWGKGISQGHSNAIRRINGVESAIQYTIPNKRIVNNCNKKIDYQASSKQKHIRLCYVALKEGADANKIKNQIVNMPNYFLGYKTIVKFVSRDKIRKMQQKLYHKGLVVKNFNCSGGFRAKMTFGLEVQSNPHFTAEIMVALARSVKRLSEQQRFGAFSVFDLPLSYIAAQDKQVLLKTIL